MFSDKLTSAHCGHRKNHENRNGGNLQPMSVCKFQDPNLTRSYGHRDIQVRLVSDCRVHRSERKITDEAMVTHSPERPTNSQGTGLLQPLGYRQCQTNCRAKFRPKITFVEGGMRLMASKKEGP